MPFALAQVRCIGNLLQDYHNIMRLINLIYKVKREIWGSFENPYY